MKLTLADYRLRVSSEIGLDNTNGSEEQGLIDAWANEGVEETLKALRCRVLDGSITLSPNSGDYAMPSQVLMLRTVFDTNGRPLEHVNVEEIYERRASSLSVAPEQVTTRYAADGDQILFYPTPSATVALPFTFIPMPAKLVGPTDSPSELPAWCHHTVWLAYGLWKAAQWDDDTSSKMGEAYEQEWLDSVTREKRTARAASGRTKPRVKFGRRGGISAAHRPGADSGL